MDGRKIKSIIMHAHPEVKDGYRKVLGEAFIDVTEYGKATMTIHIITPGRIVKEEIRAVQLAMGDEYLSYIKPELLNQGFTLREVNSVHPQEEFHGMDRSN